MPLRTRYGLNCQKVNYGKIPELLSVGYQEVAPGETFRGKISVDIHSAPTNRVINTRCYADIFVFYVPYRLLWSQWTSFVTQQASAATTTPKITNLFPENMEHRYTLSTLGAGNALDQNCAFQRRMYNLVANHYFKIHEATDLDPARS